MEEFKLDRNQIIGFVLIGIIMIWFAWYTSNQTPAETPQAQTEQIEPSQSKPEASVADSTSKLLLDQTATTVADSNATDTTFVLENQLLRLTFASKGAQLIQAQLKKYQTWDTLPLMLVDSNMAMGIRLGNDGSSIAAIYTGRLAKNDSIQTLSLSGKNAKGELFNITYTLPDSSYMLGAAISGSGFDASQKDVFIDWQLDGLSSENNIKNERQNATIYYWQGDDYDYLSSTSEDDETQENLTWVGYKLQFFSAILQTEQPINSSRMAVAPFEGDKLVKRFKSENKLGTASGNFNVNYSLYLGPNKYEILKSYGNGYQDIINFGWGIFGWIAKGVVIPIFNWLEDYGINYGIIILIMALIIKIVLFPLTYQSYKSMAKMRVLKPEIDALNEKYKDKDQTKKSQATMELYQQAGVNPLGGCIPMLVQMPILIAMFRFFPASIELRQQPFLWATDLSTYDSIISWQTQIPIISEYYGNHVSLFTILMTISTLIYTYLNSQMQGSTNQIPGMKYIMYGMPIMLVFFFNNYSAGLSYYYLVANVITFTQQFIIRSTMNEDAIHAKIQEKRSNPKKKSKFQERLAEMQKQQGNRQTRR